MADIIGDDAGWDRVQAALDEGNGLTQPEVDKIIAFVRRNITGEHHRILIDLLERRNQPDSSPIEPGSEWSYKGRLYQVLRLDPSTLSQDPVSDQWSSTVFYESLDGDINVTMEFVRSEIEFRRKFRRDK